MVRLFYSVIALAIATALAACQTDYQLLNAGARAYVAAHPTLDSKTADAIAANRVHNGMNKEQVIAAWGKPVIVQRFDNNMEYWFFGCVWPHHCTGLSLSEATEEQYQSRAYFKGDKLIDWRE